MKKAKGETRILALAVGGEVRDYVRGVGESPQERAADARRRVRYEPDEIAETDWEQRPEIPRHLAEVRGGKVHRKTGKAGEMADAASRLGSLRSRIMASLQRAEVSRRERDEAVELGDADWAQRAQSHLDRDEAHLAMARAEHRRLQAILDGDE